MDSHNVMLARVIEDLDRVARYGLDLTDMFWDANQAAERLGRTTNMLRKMAELEQYQPWTVPIIRHSREDARGTALYAPWRIKELIDLFETKPIPAGPVGWERPSGFIPGTLIETPDSENP